MARCEPRLRRSRARQTDNRLPQAARFALSEIADQIEGLNRKIGKLEHAIVMEAKRDDDMRRLCTIPGVGAIIAASIKAVPRRSR